MNTIPFTIPGNLGNIEGAEADGVLMGEIAAANPTKVLTKWLAATTGKCITDDGGTYVDDSTDFNDADADDVAPLPATPAVDDACYFGEDTIFERLDLDCSTQGAGTWTIIWEYWDGTAWQDISATDGTTGFTAATGVQSVTWTDPGDWAKNTVDGVLKYWLRARVSAYTSVTTQPLYKIGYICPTAFVWTDETTDATEATTGDVDLLPAYPLVGDEVYVGYGEKFCKIKATYSQAGAGTYTITAKYWDGDSWEALATVEDDTAGWTTAAGTEYIHFVPPTDWVANTAANGPNGQTGFFIKLELTALTSMTTQPLGTQIWVLPLKTGAAGVQAPQSWTKVQLDLNAGTKSASNANSVFLLVNTTLGTCIAFTWTKADAHVEIAETAFAGTYGDELALVQITEDGTTEFADANVIVRMY